MISHAMGEVLLPQLQSGPTRLATSALTSLLLPGSSKSSIFLAVYLIQACRSTSFSIQPILLPCGPNYLNHALSVQPKLLRSYTLACRTGSIHKRPATRCTYSRARCSKATDTVVESRRTVLEHLRRSLN